LWFMPDCPWSSDSAAPGFPDALINALACKSTVTGKGLLVSQRCNPERIDTLRYNFSGRLAAPPV
jgi:hypothetical protein